MSHPSTYSAWHRSGLRGTKEQPLTIFRTYDEALPSTLNPNDVLIKIHAISLNYREIAMLIGTYPMDIQDKGIPCSDAAAEVVATGSSVSRFAVGDRVCPNPSIGKTYEGGSDGMSVGVGTNGPGVLREYAVFDEQHLVKVPDHLSWEEASTLPCAGVTAWNALNGLKNVPEGAYALLQGTGGVSMFALILCISAGIRPIITSSSDEKIAAIKKLSPLIQGLNYKTVTDQGAEIQRLTNKRGVHFVVNNTGPKSLMDDISFLCERGGTVSMVGFLEGFDADWAPGQIMSLMHKSAKLQGIAMGTRDDFEEMNRHLEEKKVHLAPLLTDEPFTFANAEKAYERLESGNFHGKIVIKTE
ncbi:GroES-like protein [Didymella exigua CBS 183.55]|uniref:GroES-like protein n=1 Tax=Didymella exigua CBS 183.55 TaxID=1150837 RepID=A0A6A5S0Q6_9PLEO|nr:GroES-like protein [Didymella exigua CBS 183.55]KAF1933712.1 GroES-like protein [Didymella exigua CBS 183.55]